MTNGFPPDAILDQLRQLRTIVAELEDRVRSLEAGTSAAPSATLAAGDAVQEAPLNTVAELPHSGHFNHLVALTGRSIMILAVAFLLRFITEAEIVPPALGASLGVALGIGLLLLIPRSDRKGDRFSAAAHGLTAVAIALPLILETVVTLAIIPYRLGALYLAVFTAVGLVVVWRHNFRSLAWVFGLGAVILCFTLISKTGHHLEFFFILLALGAGTCLLAYSRRWHLLRWVAASALALVLLQLIFMASGGSQDLLVSESPRVIQALCLAYLLFYLSIFSWRALVQGRGVKVFDIVQSAVAVMIGFGGAVRIALNNGAGTGLIGLLALIGAVAGYTVAFAFVSTRQGRGRTFFYFATLALVFLFLGSLMIVHGPWLTWCWIALGLAASGLGGRFRRVTLRYHAAVYITLASLKSGLVSASLLAFLVPATSRWPKLSATGGSALAAATAAYLILVLTQRGREVPFARRLPRLALASLLMGGTGYFAVMALASLTSCLPPTAHSAMLALSRTLVISITAVFLGAMAPRLDLKELGWLIYPILLFGCGKLLLEDMKSGSAITLAVAFASLGGALVLGPRLLRKRETAPIGAVSPSG